MDHFKIFSGVAKRGACGPNLEALWPSHSTEGRVKQVILSSVNYSAKVQLGFPAVH